MSWSIDKIDKCHYCDKKAEYFWWRVGLFTLKMIFLCNKHRHFATLYIYGKKEEYNQVRDKWVKFVQELK